MSVLVLIIIEYCKSAECDVAIASDVDVHDILEVSPV